MPTAKYNYPRVEIFTHALPRTAAEVAESTATTLLVPFYSQKGPDNQLIAIDNFGDLTFYFGNLDYSNPMQRQILNAGNWLAHGGRVLACRITSTYDTREVELVKNTSDDTKFTWQVNDLSTENTGTPYVGNLTSAGDEFSYAIKYTLDGTDIKTSKLTLNIKKNYLVPDSDVKGNIITYIVVFGDTATGYTATKGYNLRIKNINATAFAEIFSAQKFTGDYKLAIDDNGALVITNGSNRSYSILSSGFTVPSVSDLEGSYIYTAEESDFTIPEASTVHAVKAIGSNRDAVSGENAIYWKAEAKYGGSYYNGITVSITPNGIPTLVGNHYSYSVNISISDVSGVLETYRGVSYDAISTAIKNSLYIGSLVMYKKGTGDESTDTTFTKIDEQSQTYLNNTATITFELSDGDDAFTDSESDVSKYYSALVPSLKEILKNPLVTPFDTFLDCGYPLEVKRGLVELFSLDTEDIMKLVRNDAFLVLTPYVINGTGRSDRDTDVSSYNVDGITRVTSIDDMIPQGCNPYNVAIFDQYEKITDEYSEDSGGDVFVPTTYFLANLFPYNDLMYGPQYPSAGVNRGVVDYNSINMLPTSSEKEDLYGQQLNYIEQDSRGSYVMTNLTKDPNNTSLNDISHVRVLLKIKKDVTLMGRRYIFEFNDSITKQNLNNEISSYIDSWIQNRTLRAGTVNIYDNQDDPTLDSKQVRIDLNLVFTDSIEVITVNITV